MTLLNQEIRQRLDTALSSHEHRFDRLVKLAGIDPERDLRFGDFRNVDFGESVMIRWDFTGADLRGASFDGAKA